MKKKGLAYDAVGKIAIVLVVVILVIIISRGLIIDGGKILEDQITDCANNDGECRTGSSCNGEQLTQYDGSCREGEENRVCCRKG